jgi:uncharacterized protein YbjT (DUF2867 family)
MSVLLFGATGRIGPHVARELVDRGASVTALVRDPARAAAVLPAPVRLVPGDFADDGAVQRALDDATSLLLLTPHGSDMAATQQRLLGWATKAGTRVVKISGTSSAIRADGPDAGRQHWQAEQDLAGSGAGFVILRPNAFMQTLLPPIAATVRANGVVVNPLGPAGISLIDCADIGAAAAAVLTDDRYDGQTFELTGPAAPTYADIAEVIQGVTARAVTVVDTTPEAIADTARARGASEWEAGHLAEMLTLFRAGASEFITDDVERLTGHPPRSVADYIAEHAGEFTVA